MSGIFDWVRGATVVITGEDAHGNREPIGSGFFVALGWVLSCAHVVAPARKPRVSWRDRDLEPSKILCDPDAIGEDGRFAFPDTAVLQVPIPNPEPPCVPVSPDPPVPTHRVWTRGISAIRTGRLEPFASVLEVVDAGPGDVPGFLRLQGGQLGLGMSGGPVLDLETFEVCGITKAIQEEQTLLGGWAIPIGDALAVAPPCVATENARYHKDTLRALRAGQLMFGRLPGKVLRLFEDHPGAARLLADNLPSLGFTRPQTVTDDQMPEWAVRRLFDLDLDRLIHAVLLLKDNLGVETAEAVFDHVACCLPVDDGPAWWVAGEAAEDLRREAQEENPRIGVCTDERLTVEVLMRRAFQDQPWRVLPVGGPSSAQAGDANLPPELLDDIRAEIRRLGGATEQDWATREQRREKATSRLRLMNLFFGLRIDAKPDAAQLRDLAALFPGLLFLISRRMLTLPEGVDDVLLDLVPPIDPDSEWSGVSGRNLLIENLGRAG